MAVIEWLIAMIMITESNDDGDGGEEQLRWRYKSEPIQHSLMMVVSY